MLYVIDMPISIRNINENNFFFLGSIFSNLIIIIIFFFLGM